MFEGNFERYKVSRKKLYKEYFDFFHAFRYSHEIYSPSYQRFSIFVSDFRKIKIFFRRNYFRLLSILRTVSPTNFFRTQFCSCEVFPHRNNGRKNLGLLFVHMAVCERARVNTSVEHFKVFPQVLPDNTGQFSIFWLDIKTLLQHCSEIIGFPLNSDNNWWKERDIKCSA